MKTIAFLATLLFVGCGTVCSDEPETAEPRRLIFLGQDEVFSGGDLATIDAVRVEEPPALDGRLDDACWKLANPVSGFKKYGGSSPADIQSFGYVVFDEESLYVGVGCLEPNPDNIRIRTAAESINPHADNPDAFSFDSVEIMLKPNHAAPEYYQFVVDVSGATWDAFRSNGGGTTDPDWNGAMTAATFMADDHWSAEFRIPFYCLGMMQGKVRSDWRINICRTKQKPNVLSSIARDGLYNEPHKFAVLQGLDIDFQRYFFQVEQPELVGDIREGAPSATAFLSIANSTGRDRRVEVEFLGSAESGGKRLRVEEMTMEAGHQARLNLGQVALLPHPDERTAAYEVAEPGQGRQVVVTDVDSGEQLALSNLRYPKRLQMLELDLVQSMYDAETSLEHPVTIEVTTSLSDAARSDGTIILNAIREDGSEVLATRSLTGPERVARIALDRAEWPIGRTRIEAEFQGSGGEAITEATRSFVNLPPREKTGKVLNNFVTELLNLRKADLGSQTTFTFTNPRNGWVYFATTTRGGDVTLLVDLSDPPEPFDRRSLPGGAVITEVMQFFPAGEHTLEVRAGGDASLEHLVVRAIPELAYWRFPSRHVHSDTVVQDLLKVVNCVGCVRAVGEAPEFQPYVKQWKEQGKRLIIGGALVPAYSLGPEMTAEQAYQYWRAYNGYEKPRFDGIIVDEFSVGDFPVDHYLLMAQAIRRLTEEFPAKLFYPFSMDIYGVKAVKPFMEAVIDNGSPIVWEWYEREEPNQAAAQRKLDSTVTMGMKAWREYLFEAHNHIEVCLGYYNYPPESLNENPAVDFKVWMDMQFCQLATHPAFDGLFGVMEYNAKRADRETLLWQGLLHRHYGIEGKTNLLSDEYGFRYELTHLRNPDFDDGTKGWTVAAAEDGSVGTGTFRGLGRLEGRVRGSSRGDNFLRMKRRANGPNRVTQEVRDLEPGRLYSVKMFTMDHQDMVNGRSVKQEHVVNIDIENVEMIPVAMPRFVFESSRGREAPPFTPDINPWLNYHWRVFRAQGTSATLTISDWSSDEDPGGPIGQELACNFIELQPYLAEE